MTYVPTIGLEIHAELKTATKMFCRSKNDADEVRPNRNVCPVCMAHPGTLPVINREAVRSVLRVGLALGSRLADYTEFDRKNYFYPDLPKGYQISQFKYPLVSGGALNGVPLTRIHLEEDTASSIHDELGETLVDYNRAGIPLMELVTEPSMHSASEASSFARELQILLRYLRISDANMEKGQMRVEANVSVAREGEISKGYVEIKNLNSFKAMESAVEYEIERQTRLVESGARIEKQTLGWDDSRGVTFPQRSKEVAADYRYFPDPDLPGLRLTDLSELSIDTLTRTLPELPWERRERYLKLGIQKPDADRYVVDTVLGDFMDAVSALLPGQQVALASNYIANDLVSIRSTSIRDTNFEDRISISPAHFAKLISMTAQNLISSRGAKIVLEHVFLEDADPEVIARSRALIQVNDKDSLRTTIVEMLSAEVVAVGDLRAGKDASLKYLIGQGMRMTKGAANPEVLKSLILELVSSTSN
jgi:aspartyl-tRNA(Asn)/glutamyl-tRNA(Gln) amidotransferase subunit B